jgi:hypothetical protein
MLNTLLPLLLHAEPAAATLPNVTTVPVPLVQPVQFAIAAALGALVVTGGASLRMFLSWKYVGDRLLTATLEYEETGWWGAAALWLIMEFCFLQCEGWLLLSRGSSAKAAANRSHRIYEAAWLGCAAAEALGG